MAGTVKAIPEGYHTVTPYIICNGASDVIEFYKRAFGAVEIMRMAGPNGKIGHAEIRISDLLSPAPFAATIKSAVSDCERLLLPHRTAYRRF
jgi:hypothetical protein